MPDTTTSTTAPYSSQESLEGNDNQEKDYPQLCKSRITKSIDDTVAAIKISDYLRDGKLTEAIQIIRLQGVDECQYKSQFGVSANRMACTNDYRTPGEHLDLDRNFLTWTGTSYFGYRYVDLAPRTPAL